METTTGTTSNARILTITAFVLSGLALLFAPVILGGIGLVLAIIAKVKGDPLATWAIATSIVGMIAGVALGVAVMDAMT